MARVTTIVVGAGAIGVDERARLGRASPSAQVSRAPRMHHSKGFGQKCCVARAHAAWKKQISKMGRKTRVAKKVVGSANDRAERGEEADGSTEELAVAGMGLQEPTAAAAEGSGGESMAPGDAGPPMHGALGDVTPQPAAVDPSPGEGAVGESEPVAAVLTIEQRGAATRASFKEQAARQEVAGRGRRAAA